MALIPELNVVTREVFMPLIVNQIWRKSPLLYRIFRISKEGQWGMAYKSDGGRAILEPLEFQEALTDSASHGAYQQTDSLDIGLDETQDVVTAAKYTWKRYYVSVAIDNLEVKMNQGKARVFDEAAIKARSAMKILRKDLAQDLFAETYDGNKKMVGLQAITAAPASGSDTVGEIPKTTSWWQGVQNTSGSSRDLTWVILNDLYTKTKKFGDGEPPTIFVTSDGVLQNYEDSFSKTIVTGTSNTHGLRLALSPGQAIEGGFPAFYFKRIPIVADPYCPSNTLFALNEKYLHWRILKQFDTRGWVNLKDISGKDYLRMIITGYGAFTTSCCRKQGIATNLNEA